MANNDVLGSQGLGGGSNPYFDPDVFVPGTAPLLDLDFVRSQLRASEEKLSNDELADFVDSVNSDADAELAVMGLPTAANLTSDQRNNARIYFALEVGERIYMLDDDKKAVLDNLRKIKLRYANKLVPLDAAAKSKDFAHNRQELRRPIP